MKDLKIIIYKWDNYQVLYSSFNDANDLDLRQVEILPAIWKNKGNTKYDKLTSKWTQMNAHYFLHINIKNAW